MKIEEKHIRTLRLTSNISGLFMIFIAVIMILGYLQLKNIKPLENPALEALKEQYDSDPNNEDLKQQVRALDLMSRKAFFSARWQIETGTILLLVSALIFVLSQRILMSSSKKLPDKAENEYDLLAHKKKSRIYLLASSGLMVILAFSVSFILRKNLPDPLPVPDKMLSEDVSNTRVFTTNTKTPSQSEAISEAAMEISNPDPVNEPPDQPAMNKSINNETRTVSGSTDENKTIETGHTVSENNNSNINYPFFRGHNGNGLIAEGPWPTKWDGKTGLNIEWKKTVAYHGYSSPVIWGKRIFITGADGAETTVMCYNKDNGELLWTSSATGIAGEPDEAPQTSDDTGLAAPSAATNGTVVCAIFGTGNLVCLDMEGNRIWAKNLGLPDNHYGHSSSLIIYDDLLLVQYDHFRKKSLIALNLNNGNLVWETLRQVDISWASPVISDFNGIKQVILTSAPAVKSYDIETGTELWSANCMSGEVGPSVATNSRYVFAVNDFATLSAIDPLNKGEIIWQDNEYTPEVASPVATEELVFVLTTWGGVAAYDAASGELAWDHEFDYGFYASPVIADGMVYMLDQAGVMHIVRAEREFELVDVSALGERANTTPAFSEGKIYMRTDNYLYCITNND